MIVGKKRIVRKKHTQESNSFEAPREVEDKMSLERDAIPEESNSDNGSENQAISSQSKDSEEYMESMHHPELFFKNTEYIKSPKIQTKCAVFNTVDLIKRKCKTELAWFESHPQFRHIFHMPQELNRKLLGMWMLLLRTANTESKVIWLVVNGVPIRYSMREHALLCGLDCLEYPCNKEELGSNKFKDRNFDVKQIITVAVVREKLLSMKSCGDRLKMAVLYFLCTVIKGKAKFNGPIDQFLVRIVDDLEACKTFPWGRFTFEDVVSNVYHLMNHLDGFVNGTCNIPGFIVPLEILAFECIPNLKNSFREDVEGCNSECPRMCKKKFKVTSMKGYPLEEICDALGTTKKISSFLVPDLDEQVLMARIVQGESDEEGGSEITDRWIERLTVEHKRICWKYLYELDVAVRVFSNTKEKKQVGNVESPGCENFLKELEEKMIKTMEEGFKGMEGKIHDLEKKLDGMERIQRVWKRKVRVVKKNQRDLRTRLKCVEGAVNEELNRGTYMNSEWGYGFENQEEVVEDETEEEVKMDGGAKGGEEKNEEMDVSGGGEHDKEKDMAEVREAKEKDMAEGVEKEAEMAEGDEGKKDKGGAEKKKMRI